jgi:hypothetical protein
LSSKGYKGEKAVSENEKYQIAKAYVDKQFANMKRNGLKVRKVSSKEYDQMVRRLARDIKSNGSRPGNATAS